MFTMYSVKP